MTKTTQTPGSHEDLSAADGRAGDAVPDAPADAATDGLADTGDRGTLLAGLGFGALAYASWGFIAFYFKAVSEVDPLEVLCHRVVWSVVLLAGLVSVRRQWGTCRDLLGSRRTWVAMSVSTGLIAVNWLVFIYAVSAGRLLEASLGYFINPLVSILLGMVFLGERLRRLQWTAVGLAVLGVGFYTARVGTLPWISIVLAVSFGLYGLVRKRARPGPIVGLFFETSLLFPLAAGYLVLMSLTGWREIVFASRPEFGGPGGDGPGSLGLDLLLAAGGLVTTLPLLWFAGAARRLRLSTLGFMQYTAPTLQFLIAVLAFGEPFDGARAAAFGVIWCGIALFVVDSVRHGVRGGRARRAAAAIAVAEG